ncbi:MAG: hypothetical protein J6W29_03730 [Neisseriaceae bacterium]|nr:hypothetical protein [Neisseriaceae bacterium]
MIDNKRFFVFRQPESTSRAGAGISHAGAALPVQEIRHCEPCHTHGVAIS